MNVFEAVKQSVTARQAVEHYGIRVGRNGMVCCPFHEDRTPSMKADRRYHCFGCQADGDVIDFVSRLEGIPAKEAALRLAADFSIPYEDREPPNRSRSRPKIPQESPEQQFRRMYPETVALHAPELPPQDTAGIPGAAIPAHGAPLFPGTVRLLSFTAPMGTGLCPQDPGGRMEPFVCGSLAEQIPCGMSAGRAAVFGYAGTGFPCYRIRRGSEEP